MLSSNAGGHGRVGWRWRLGGSLVLSVILIWIPQPVYAAVGGLALAQWRTLLTGLVIVGLAGIAVSTVLTHRQPIQEASSNDEAKPLLREIPGWAIWAGMAGLMVVGLIATWWLVTTYGSGDVRTIEQNRIKLEAIKLAGSVVVGTGGVAALLLAARRQRVSELDLLQRDRVADINRHDADERRATELYTAAAEQLASDKAPVRMAGMYGLSRLGETNENLRQTIINLLCAYLRMPDISIEEGAKFSDPEPDCQENAEAHPRPENSSQTIVLDLASAPLTALTSLAPHLPTQKQQERQVRLTAQRLLAQHLRPNRREDGTPMNRAYWSGMEIDLTDASLHKWDFTGCEALKANFRRAQFHDITRFSGAQLHDDSSFDRTQFYGETWFNAAQFHGQIWFNAAQFHEKTWFNAAQFHRPSWFDLAHFHKSIRFNESQFRSLAGFGGVQFHGATWFYASQFHDDALFGAAQFHTFSHFDKALFSNNPTFEGAWVRITDGHEQEFKLPTGWAVCGINLEGWGRLARDEPSNGQAS